MCAHKEREECICGCCTAIENSNSLCWPITKNSLRRWETQRIGIPTLPCPYVTSLVPLYTHNHIQGGLYVYDKTKSDIQMLMCRNHWPIRNDGIMRGYGNHLVHAWKKVSPGIFWCDDPFIGAFRWRIRYLWARTCPLDVSYGKVLKDIEGLCSKLRKTWIKYGRRICHRCTILSRRVWDGKVDPTMNDEILESVGWPRILTLELHNWIH